MSGRRGLGWGLVGALALICLTGCTLDLVAARQVQATGLWGELVAGETFGQSFVAGEDNLYRIDVSTATFDRVNTAGVNFYLKADPMAPSAIFSTTIPGPDVQNQRPTSISFPSIPDSEGKSFYFALESPDSTPGDAVSVYATHQDSYPGGNAYRNGQAVVGDLAFTAYSAKMFRFSDILTDLRLRAAQDLGFFSFYGLLVLTAIMGLSFTLRRSG